MVKSRTYRETCVCFYVLYGVLASGSCFGVQPSLFPESDQGFGPRNFIIKLQGEVIS